MSTVSLARCTISGYFGRISGNPRAIFANAISSLNFANRRRQGLRLLFMFATNLIEILCVPFVA